METRLLNKIPVLPGMKRYGDATPLYTRGVAMYAIFFSVILGMQWLVDVWAWGNTWGFTYAADDILGRLWAWILGGVFATVILIFEVMYLTQDTSSSTTQGDVFRLLFALFIGWGLTSVAVEVSWFAPDIEKSIVADEKASVDNVVRLANATEEKKQDQLLEAAKKELGGSATAAVQKAQEDLDHYLAERNTQRSALVDEENKTRKDYINEVGGAFSGRPGIGHRATAMQSEREKITAQVSAFDADTIKEADRLTRIRDEKQKESQQALQARLDKIRIEKQATMERIAKLSLTTPGRDELAATYGGGSWQASRGALHRFSKMVEMTDTPWTPAWYVKWLCRCIMLVLTIVIIGGKRFAPQDWKQYCSRAQQGRAGHLEARDMIAFEGYNPDTYGLSHKVRLRLEQHFAARRQLVEAHLSLGRLIRELALPEANGLCRTIEQIRGQLHRDWLENGEVCRLNLAGCEEAMKRDGIDVPAWPDVLGNGVNLLYNLDPWFVSKEYLGRTCAWIDPASSIDERRRLTTVYQASQASLRSLLFRQTGELLAAIESNPHIPVNVLWRQRQRWLEQDILPLLEKMETQERRLRQLGGEVPAWSRHFPDPRAEILASFTDFSEYELRQLGWVGPEKLGTV